jgi:hypothetical protein
VPFLRRVDSRVCPRSASKPPTSSFRGEERLKIAIKDLQSVTAQAGTLHLDFPGGPASIELGAAGR